MIPNTVIINLDVIPGKFGQKPTSSEVDSACKQSYQNYLRLKNLGFNVMPVFHQHDNWEWLDKYLAHKPWVLGVSPANDMSTKARIPFLNKVFSIVKDSVRCHGLAVTSQKLMARHPWYSVDSATWMMSGLHGTVYKFEDRRLIAYPVTPRMRARKKPGGKTLKVFQKDILIPGEQGKYVRYEENLKAFIKAAQYYDSL